MLGLLGQAGERDLVGPPEPLGLLAVHFGGPVHPFGVTRTSAGQRGRSAGRRSRAAVWIARISSTMPSSAAAIAWCIGARLVALHDVRPVAVPGEQALELRPADPRQDRRVRDLVAVQVEDREDRAVGLRVEELVRVPRRGQRPRLRLAVADHARHQEVRVVERRAVGVGERVAELAPLVDRPGRLGRHVARDAAGKGELPEQPPQAVRVLGDLRVHLGVGPFEVRVGDHGRAAVAGAADVERVQVELPDHAIEVHVHEVETRRRAPVSEQPRLHVAELERLPEQRVVEQIDLADGHVVRGSPVGVHERQLSIR